MQSDMKFNNEFIKKLNNTKDEFSLEFKVNRGERKKEFCERTVNVYAKTKNCMGELQFVYDANGFLRIDSSLDFDKSLLFFNNREIKVNNLNYDSNFYNEIVELSKKYTDISIGNSKKYFKTLIKIEEKVYFNVLDINNVELVKSFVLISNGTSNSAVKKFRIDFFQNGFKFGKKMYKYEEYDQEKIRKNLKIIVYGMLKNYAEEVNVDLNLKDFDTGVSLIKLLNY